MKDVTEGHAARNRTGSGGDRNERTSGFDGTWEWTPGMDNAVVV